MLVQCNKILANKEFEFELEYVFYRIYMAPMFSWPLMMQDFKFSCHWVQEFLD